MGQIDRFCRIPCGRAGGKDGIICCPLFPGAGLGAHLARLCYWDGSFYRKREGCPAVDNRTSLDPTLSPFLSGHGGWRV